MATKKGDTPASQPEGQTNIAAAPAASWKDIMSKAKDGLAIFPKLEFTDEGSWDVEFREEVPRAIQFPDEFNRDEKGEKVMTPGLAINVVDLSTGDPRSIVMRADPNHALTRSVGQLADRKNGKLNGVRARIITSLYDNKKYKNADGTPKKTRGYAVSELPRQATAPSAEVP